MILNCTDGLCYRSHHSKIIILGYLCWNLENLSNKSSKFYYRKILRRKCITNFAITLTFILPCFYSFLKDFRDCFWYLDGHHDTLASGNATLPEVVQQQFSGFNIPEAHKHVMKRLDQETLTRKASILYEHLEKVHLLLGLKL